jgi:hypothetical protein
VEPGGTSAVDIFRVDEPDAVTEALRGRGIRVLRPEEVYATVS